MSGYDEIHSSPYGPGDEATPLQGADSAAFRAAMRGRLMVFPAPDAQYFKRAWDMYSRELVSYTILTLVFLGVVSASSAFSRRRRLTRCHSPSPCLSSLPSHSMAASWRSHLPRPSRRVP